MDSHLLSHYEFYNIQDWPHYKQVYVFARKKIAWRETWYSYNVGLLN